MHVGTCEWCKQLVTEADSWTHDGPDMGGYPPTVPVYHSSCRTEQIDAKARDAMVALDRRTQGLDPRRAQGPFHPTVESAPPELGSQKRNR